MSETIRVLGHTKSGYYYMKENGEVWIEHRTGKINRTAMKYTQNIALFFFTVKFSKLRDDIEWTQHGLKELERYNTEVSKHA